MCKFRKKESTAPVSRVLYRLHGVCHLSNPWVTPGLKRSTLRRMSPGPVASLLRPSSTRAGNPLSGRFTWTCSPQQAQPNDHPLAGGLLHHLLTLTPSRRGGGRSLLPSPTVTNSFHFQKWGALCCPDFPLVPKWHQRQTVAVLSSAKIHIFIELWKHQNWIIANKQPKICHFLKIVSNLRFQLLTAKSR